MNAGILSLKARMEAGLLSTGCWLFTGSAAVAEILTSGTNIDTMIVDLEHSPGTTTSALNQLRATGGQGKTMMVRPPNFQAGTLKPFLDMGFGGIMVPDIRSADDALMLVDATRYPPHGHRGAHYTVSRAAKWGASGSSYFEHSNSEIVIGGMIEAIEAIDQIPYIASIRGMDMLFIGPLDLSLSAGIPGDYTNPIYREIEYAIEKKTIDSGLALGGPLLPGRTLQEMADKGYLFVTIGSDVNFIRNGAKLHHHIHMQS